MRKRIIIAGHSREGLELVPGLEANPNVELCALLTDDPAGASATLAQIDPAAARRLGPRITADVDATLALPGLRVVIDAEAPARVRERLPAKHDLQVATPGLALLLYAFGLKDALGKPDLLKALREILNSADLTGDRRSVLDLVLQVAVGATGADRGSLMLWDPIERALRVEVALGIEEELIPKIRVASGDGIAGRAFAAGRAMLLHGKADRERWQIVRERDDVESAISAPLAHEGRPFGVLNLSHTRNHHHFTQADLVFVEELARLDARVIARAEEYHGLLRESQTLRFEAQMRRLLAGEGPLPARLQAVCVLLAEPLRGGVGRLWLLEPEGDGLLLQASSTGSAPPPGRERLQPGQGIVGRSATSRHAVWLSGREADSDVCHGALPLLVGGALVGVLEIQGSRDPANADPAERLAGASTALAEELAAALRVARLERESRRAERLGEVIAAMGTCKELREQSELVTASALSLVEAQAAVLRLFDEPTGRFRVASQSWVGPWRTSSFSKLEHRLATRAVRSRQLLRVPDLASDPAWAEHACGVTSALIVPLLRDGRSVGSLSVLGRLTDDPLLGERFGPADEAVLERLVQHAQAAMATLRPRAPAPLDPAAVLPGRAQLRERLVSEIARSRMRGHRLALLALHCGRLEEMPGSAADALAAALAKALHKGLRDFDVLVRLERGTFAALVPEPDGDVSRVVSTLYRCAREVLDAHGDAARGVPLRIGYAVFPDDGGDADTLLGRAVEARVEAL